MHRWQLTSALVCRPRPCRANSYRLCVEDLFCIPALRRFLASPPLPAGPRPSVRYDNLWCSRKFKDLWIRAERSDGDDLGCHQDWDCVFGCVFEQGGDEGQIMSSHSVRIEVRQQRGARNRSDRGQKYEFGEESVPSVEDGEWIAGFADSCSQVDSAANCAFREVEECARGYFLGARPNCLARKKRYLQRQGENRPHVQDLVILLDGRNLLYHPRGDGRDQPNLHRREEGREGIAEGHQRQFGRRGRPGFERWKEISLQEEQGQDFEPCQIVLGPFRCCRSSAARAQDNHASSDWRFGIDHFPHLVLSTPTTCTRKGEEQLIRSFSITLWFCTFHRSIPIAFVVT